ncbi:hypothetical protein HK105_204738 [Polyrhizophydium stewartii]|uniref:Tudor domain-containing protein n=1 Tax=Polyrhizophydium stewartii TaxID=2732419 RepID=A0ABR4N8C6_9FUNG
MAELESYQYQLQQVEEALRRDGHNPELAKLRDDLKQVIALFSHVPSWVQRSKAAAAASSAAAAQADAEHHRPLDAAPLVWQTGDTVLAKYSDGQFYEATVVGPSALGPGLVDVVYTGFDQIEQVAEEDIRPPAVPTDAAAAGAGAGAAAAAADVAVPTAAAAAGASSYGHGHAANGAAAAGGADKNKAFKKKKPRKEGPSKAEQEQLERQNAWLKFAGGAGAGSGAGVKKKAAPKLPWQSGLPVKRKSMFSTPDDPNARVGVIGSGRPMTEFHRGGRHVFARDEEPQE